MIWVLLLACGEPPPPPPDMRAYVEAATLAASDPTAAAERCEAVGTALVSECLANNARLAPPEQGTALCARVPDPMWSQECYFGVAEAAVDTEGAASAVKRCVLAGRFRENCITHLWRLHAAKLLDAMPAAEAAEAYLDARAWAEGSQLDPASLDTTFWSRFYEGAVQSSQALDARWCDTFRDDLQPSCEEGVPAALRRALTSAERDVRNSGRVLPKRALCAEALPPNERVERHLGVRYVPGEVLDGVVAQFAEKRCR